MRTAIPVLILTCVTAARLTASTSDALAIDAAIQARHLPFGTILDPIFTSAASTTIQGYTPLRRFRPFGPARTSPPSRFATR